VELLKIFKPEIWLSALALIVFIPMTRILGENPSFDLWRFSLMFTVLIGAIFFYAHLDMR
jgi:hypothetical protein